jgi:hypothetical protein
MQSEKDVLQSRRCRSKRQRNEAVYTCNFALPDAFVGETSGKVATEIAVVNGFFVSVCLLDDSDTMRYVGGGVLNNPVTRASQSRERGRIPRARWLKQSGIVRCDDMAPRVKRQAQSELSVVTRLGCALLKHSPRVNNGSNKRVVRPNQRRAGTDQGSAAPTWRLVQRTSLRRQTHPRPSGAFSSTLPWLQRDASSGKRFQGLGLSKPSACNLE